MVFFMVVGLGLFIVGCGDETGTSLSSGGGSTQYCDPGYCYSGGYCCPKSTRYYCNGRCVNDCLAAGCTNCKAICY